MVPLQGAHLPNLERFSAWRNATNASADPLEHCVCIISLFYKQILSAAVIVVNFIHMRPSTNSSDSRQRRSAKVFPARENDFSDDVLNACTLSRHLATLTSFLHTLSLLDQYANKLQVGVTGISTTAGQVRIRRIYPRGNPAIVRSIPAVFPQHSYPYPRETCGFRRIPAVPSPYTPLASMKAKATDMSWSEIERNN